MGVFDDKKFEQLDWMTQITETIDSDLNGLLARLPDRKVFDNEYIMKNCSSSYGASISVSSVVRELIQKETDGLNHMTYEEEGILAKCFTLELEHDDIEVDVGAGTVSGQIAMVKTVPTLTDEELLPLMGHRGLEALTRTSWGDAAPFERMNEILDLVGGCEEAMRTRSAKKKITALRDRLKTILTTNEWRIRDMTLANKVGFWLRGYIQNGNLADLTNFCKLKVMTHNNMPIYSVAEEK
jgi:hypothetical protein